MQERRACRPACSARRICPGARTGEAIGNVGTPGVPPSLLWQACPRRDVGDNRLVWRMVLREGGLVHVGPLVSFYLSAADSTGGVERDLGKILKIQTVHGGPGNSAALVEDCAVVLLDGPVSEAGVFRRTRAWRPPVEGGGDAMAGVSALHPTAFAVACSRLWVCNHGRRFGRRAPRADRGKTRKASRGGDSAVKRRRTEAATLAVRAEGPLKVAGKTVSDAPLSAAAQAVSAASPFWTPGHARFQRQTERTLAECQESGRARILNRDPYPTPPLRVGGQHKDRRPANPVVHVRVHEVAVSPGTLDPPPGACAWTVPGLWKAVVVVVPSVDLVLSVGGPDPKRPALDVWALLLMIALGKTIVGRRDFDFDIAHPWRVPGQAVRLEAICVPQADGGVAPVPKYEFQFGSGLEQKHRHLVQCLKLLCRSSRGSWKICSSDVAGSAQSQRMVFQQERQVVAWLRGVLTVAVRPEVRPLAS